MTPPREGGRQKEKRDRQRRQRFAQGAVERMQRRAGRNGDDLLTPDAPFEPELEAVRPMGPCRSTVTGFG